MTGFRGGRGRRIENIAPRRAAFVIVGLCAALLVGACGGGDSVGEATTTTVKREARNLVGGDLGEITSASTTTDPPEGPLDDTPFCNTGAALRDVFAEDGVSRDSEPADVERFLERLGALLQSATSEAPPEVRDDLAATRQNVTLTDRVLAQFDYDVARFQAEAGDELRAQLNDPETAAAGDRLEQFLQEQCAGTLADTAGRVDA